MVSPFQITVRRTLALVLFASLCSPVVAAPEDFESLLKIIPGTANAILVMDAEALLNTSVAKREGWKRKQLQAYVNHGISLPPGTERVVVAASLNPSEGLKHDWKIGLLDVHDDVSLVSVARNLSGTLETLGSQDAVVTRTGQFIVKLTDKRVAVIGAGNRQVAGRWLRSTENATMALTPILRQAASKLSAETQIVMAMDLQDLVPPDRIRERLAESESTKGKKFDVDAVVDCLSSIKGVVLTVSVGQEKEGEIRVEFGESANELASFAKPLLLEILADHGTMIDDFESWSPRIEKDGLVLKGLLSAPGMRQLLSLVVVPSGDLTAGEQKEEAPADPMTVKSEATQQYYTALSTLINDVRRQLKNTRDDQASWSERYAEKIDNLPILNVDEELLTFAGNVSGSLRYQAVSKRSAGIRQGVRAAQPVYTTNSYYGPFGGYAWETRRDNPDRTRINREEMAQYQQVRFSEWQKIDSGLVEVRRSLTEKYQVEFHD